MPDLLELYNQSISDKEVPNSEAQDQNQNLENPDEQQGYSLAGDVTGDERQNQAMRNEQYSSSQLGAISTKNTRDTFEDPDSWSPEYSNRNFFDEAGQSIMRGIGNHIIKGTGDMLQVIGGLFDKSLIKGNFISDALQNAGEDFAAQFKSYIPEELQADNLTWSSMMQPKFWSTQVAEMIPQLAEFIFLSKGGSALAKGGAKSLLKKLPGTGKSALGKIVPGTGKGLVGALATDAGLTTAGNQVFGAIGGGLAGNLFSGMLNAAEVINTHKDLKDSDGNPLYTEEELQQMASGTLKNNASYALVDMASWGMTFGGGWKAIKGLNPVAKGGKLWNGAQQSKVIGKMFSYDVAPIMKGMARVGKKALAEGFEEQVQESWEEWAKMKAINKVTGEGSDDLTDLNSFYDFFTSKENKATRVLSFAVGALGGGAFNVKDIFNQKAEENYKLYDRAKNLSEIINKQGTEQELEWQQYHIRQTMADIVIDGKAELYDDFSNYLVENGNITEDEKKAYDNMFQNFKEVKQKGVNLNVKGLQALLYNNAIETHANQKIEEFEAIAKENIDNINSNESLTENQKKQKISEIEDSFANRIKAASLLLAESKQNQANLILGKKASPLTVDIVTDKYGNNMVVGGLSSEQFNEYTLEGEKQAPSTIQLKTSDLKEKGKEIYNSVVDKASGMFNNIKDKVVKPKEDNEAPPEARMQEEGESQETIENQENPNESTEKEKTSIEKLDPVSDEIFSEFEKSGFVPEKTLDTIATQINSEAGLSPREEAIRSAYKNDVLDRIVKKTLGTENKSKKKPSFIDNLSKKDISEIEAENKVSIKRTDEGYDINTKDGKQVDKKTKQKIDDIINSKIEENLTVQNDGDLTQDENDFIQNEVLEKGQKRESIEDAQENKNKKAKEQFQVNKKNVIDATKKIPLDFRNTKSTSIRKTNIKMFEKAKAFIQKLGKSKNITDRQNISQNEIDNYLNTFTTYNLEGPANIDRMASVNHQLKRMFPNTNDPVQVIITKNLFESIGSQGLGSTLAGTIYIDEKAWNQPKVFMHEMSHVYYQLSRNEPETQKLVNSALANKELVERTKQLYDDYTLYNVNLPGETIQMTKGQIINNLIRSGADKNQLEEFLQGMIDDGDISTIPLRQQKYLIEEMFVAQLEGPLSQRFDKVFNTKNDVKRQADTKMWWGLLRKKGDIIEDEDGVSQMLRKLYDEKDIPQGDLQGFIFDTFKAVTKGVQMDSFGLDSRAEKTSQEYAAAIADIEQRKSQQINYKPEDISSLSELIDRMDAMDNAMENDGQMFYDKSFDSKIKATSRILRRFGVVYNKTLRAKELLKNKDNVSKKSNIKLFNRDLFESTIYNLAIENNTSNEFIYNIENSALEEIQAFNRYLDKVFPANNLQLLNSMHFVLSNSKHIVGFRNTINDKGEHSMVNSLSNSELNDVENVIASIKYSFDNRNTTSRWNDYVNAVNRIYKDKIPEAKDIVTVLEMLAPKDFKFDKVQEQGYLTYKGVNVPIDTLITGFVKRQFLFNKNKDGKIVFNQNNTAQVYYAAARPLIEAMVNTNRKFSPLSSVKNAEGNMEPVRITNNHLTKEIDAMIDFLSIDELGNKKTKEEFLKRFSHLSEPKRNELGRSYVPNQFLENIYDQYQNGILPTISQYHGLEDTSNAKGSLYKNSTALEQGIEDLLIFMETSRNPSGNTNKTYLGNMGAFSDSPRKFFMNMKRINYEEVFITKDGKTQFNTDGKVLNSIYSIHKELYVDKASENKAVFRNQFRQAISDTVEFVNNNGEQLSKLPKMEGMFSKNNKLNRKGQEIIAEYAINSIVNGYNIADVFMPQVKGKDIAKRFKMNSSPVMSIKNPNLKIEPIFFKDEEINGSIAGTDSGMYILKEDAERFQNIGKGVFDMNGGFKFLNASIEKDNPNFKGKTAYLKGYTTIVDEKHSLYPLLKARKDKYEAYHEKTFGTKPSMDLSDGTHNHIAIAVPQSSDKSNFIPQDFNEKDFSEAALKENQEEANKYYDNLYYDQKGNFLGISAYNFGPQQLMDKKTEVSNTPVQMINSIIVNATLNGKLNEAYEIQRLLSSQKRKNLQNLLDKIKSENINDYKKIIMEGLNKEDMNQAQRILLEDNGSLAHPYVNEIVVNQLAKTIRRLGNKLETPGTYAHQKPDSSWKTQATGNKSLKGYSTNADGSTGAAEIVLPKHMENKVKPRTKVTLTSTAGQLALLNSKAGQPKKTRNIAGTEILDVHYDLKQGALDLAQRRFGTSRSEAEKYIGREYDKYGTHIGYYVKGEHVIASRVPGHGPSSTGVFEVIGFDQGEGNQVMVPSEFNEIVGSDNDGDALFVQTKSNKKGYEDWNKAFDKIKDYWLSPEMSEQIQAKMVFEEETKKIVENINNTFPKNKDYVMPFSPKAKMIDYNNTMVSKRNVGPVFNIHKITNMFAATEVPITRQIQIGNDTYNQFNDIEKGNNSRNQQSAILANIILDNAKHGFADDIGLNEYNVSQAVLMVNLGITLEQVGKILNSPAAVLWSDINRSNSSIYHDSIKKEKIIKKIEKELGIKTYKGSNIKISLSNIESKGQNQAAVLELLSYLADMNSEIQKISTIMGGHNKIHVNPLVLEKQIKDYDEVIKNDPESSTLILTDAFKQSPDMKHYIDVARATLNHQKNLNPVYSNATTEILKTLTSKIGEDLSANQIEEISQDILKFNTSRLIGLNNKPIEYVKNLLDEDVNNPESIYNKLNVHMEYLRKQVFRDPKDIKKSWTMLDNSVLFGQALSMNLDGKGRKKYISAKTDFVNDSFNEIERERAQQEFEELPTELRNDLILYDMIKNGWKGPFSLAPFFGKETNFVINMASTDNMQNKNKELSPKIARELEKVIALRAVAKNNNPFDKIYPKGDIKNNEAVIDEIFKNKKIFNKIIKGQPLYISVIKERTKKLYELESFTDDEVKQITTERTWSQKRQRTESIARNKIKEVPNTLYQGGDINLTNIADKNVMEPYAVFPTGQGSRSLDFMTEASINYEEVMSKFRQTAQESSQSLDAREDFYIDTFTRKAPLTEAEYATAMEFKPYTSDAIKKGMYKDYLAEKERANKLIEQGVLNNLENKSSEELLSMYNTYGQRDVYGFSGIITPVTKQLAHKLMHEQAELQKKNNVKGKEIGGDVSAMKSYLMSGSTIPSNHPASQGLARMMEREYKSFIDEKKKYIQEMNKITDALYKERLGYGGKSGLTVEGIKNFALRLKDALFSNREDVYDRLYGNLVIREEFLNDQGTLVMNYKLKPANEIEKEFEEGWISKAEKDFYDYFRKTTDELMPKNIKEFKQDYIPHTSMSKLEAFSSRGLLGLLANSRHDDQTIYDVKMSVNGEMMNFKKIEDSYKYYAARGFKNNIGKIKEYRTYKKKAEKLLKEGKNEDGSPIMATQPFVETALGFGAINRFSNNRSIKATELPSMDLNKALADYIHSSLFVNGNEKFQGMEKLQGYIDGVLAWNHDNNLPNMNNHVQKVWKDYFLRNKRQTSALGETADRVIYGLTRLNLFYALGYSANKNTGGLYALGNIVAGKYHNIKDIGGKAWLKGEARFWGLDKGFKGGIDGINKRRKRMANIMKSLNFMEINVYDQVSMENKGGLDKIFSDIALAPMIYSEKWIQQVHMLGLLTDEQLNKFDEAGNYKEGVLKIDNEDLIRLEDQVKSSHGRGYQPTDQRAIQMYSWGNMMLQFSRFIPTMIHDRFAKEDVNIYGRETIGTMRAVGKMLRYVFNNPADFVNYRASLSDEQRKRLDSGLKGMAMASIISLASSSSETANSLFWDINYYWNYGKLTNKMIPAPIQSTENLVGSLF